MICFKVPGIITIMEKVCHLNHHITLSIRLNVCENYQRSYTSFNSYKVNAKKGKCILFYVCCIQETTLINRLPVYKIHGINHVYLCY
jgi:hypothetical protein